ncbi:MAG: SDR family oxidoreductase [Chloroflexi bacterium]|nr:SDR family oxidoreductase [Chloroflexota bacterium]
MDYTDKLALVTGGSSGIGLAISKGLARRGANVWVLSRNHSSSLSNALKEIQAEKISPHQAFGMLQADVDKPDQVSECIGELMQDVGVPDLVVNSAGVAHPGYFEELDLEIFREMMEINFFGTLQVTKTVIPHMVERGSGIIVNISSMAGFLGLFGYTAYGASKYAVRGFSDALRAEMKPKGIQVSLVFPPDTDTPQLAYENQYKPPETKEIDSTAKILTAEAVADEVLKGVAKGKYLILPGFDSKLYYRLSGWFNFLIYPIMDYMVADAKRKVNRTKS